MIDYLIVDDLVDVANERIKELGDRACAYKDKLRGNEICISMKFNINEIYREWREEICYDSH